MGISMKVIGLISGLLISTGCATPDSEKSISTNQEVLARCAPAESLLSKNFMRTRGIDLGIFSAGDSVSYQGAILTSEAAERVSKLNAMCKAWVARTVTDEQYTRFLLSTVVESSVAVSGTPGKDISLENLLIRLEVLEQAGALPKRASDYALLTELRRLKKANPTDRLLALEAEYASIRGNFDTTVPDLAEKQTELARVIGALSVRVGEIEDAEGERSIEPTDGPLRVYFATDSSELTYFAMRYLDDIIAQYTGKRVHIDIRGYSDPRGTYAHNQALSERRAKTVAQYLQENLDATVSVTGQSISAERTNDISRMRFVEILIDEPI